MSQPSLSEALRGVVRRDLLLAMRHRSDVAMSIFFVVIVASLFPLGVGPEAAVLRMIGPGVLWVTALLACQARAITSIPPKNPHPGRIAGREEATTAPRASQKSPSERTPFQ